jgi:predicted kinase
MGKGTRNNSLHLKIAAMAQWYPQAECDRMDEKRSRVPQGLGDASPPARFNTQLPAAHQVAGRLLIFCGIPGSGKTTVARLVAMSIDRSIHIQTDAFRKMITKPNYTAGESELVYSACVATAKEALDSGYLVILDGTFGTRRRREKTLLALSGHCTDVIFVQVKCSLETALIRNSGRSAIVPEENLKGILSAFEPPDGAIIIDTTSVSPETAARHVVEATAYPLVPPE